MLKAFEAAVFFPGLDRILAGETSRGCCSPFTIWMRLGPRGFENHLRPAAASALILTNRELGQVFGLWAMHADSYHGCFMGTPPPIQLANLGMADSLILMVLALVVFGPRRLPQIGRQIGKLMFEFRKASNDFKFQMEEELRLSEEADRRKKEEEERQRAAALAASSQASVSAPTPSIEAQADIGAVEPPTASSSEAETKAAEAYPPETSEADSVYKIPHLQPPRTGEQVSASAPFSTAASEEAVVELNPEADVAANADSVEAHTAVNGRSDTTPDGTVNAEPVTTATNGDIESSTSSKEPVSQHG